MDHDREARAAEVRRGGVRCVDVGATSIAAGLVELGAVSRPLRRRTAPPITPAELVEAVTSLCERLPATPLLAVGFPGVVVGGQIRAGGNLGDEAAWTGFDLAGALRDRLGGLVRVANDADLAALACAEGSGVELTVTLGTGVGTGLVVDGVLQHHLELSEIPLGPSATLDAHIGEPARKLLDEEMWNERAVEVLHLLDRLVRPDRLWLTGGNARRVRRSSLRELEERLWVVHEPVGLLGGALLF